MQRMTERTSCDFDVNVLGSRLGNNFNMIGRANSANGIITMIANGTKRNKSAVVLTSRALSRRVNVCPCRVLASKDLHSRTLRAS